jgi:membrane protein
MTNTDRGDGRRQQRGNRRSLSRENADLLHEGGWQAVWGVLREATFRLWDDLALPLAGNIAFRGILAVFPFLILVSSLTAYIGNTGMAEVLITFLISVVPEGVAAPLGSEVRNVLLVPRGSVVSLGALMTVWFASGGVDGLRVALNRAYDVHEDRGALHLYVLEALVVVAGALMLVAVARLLLLGPLVDAFVTRVSAGRVLPFNPGAARYPLAAAVLTVGLFAAHVVLPAERMRFAHLWPGVLLTVVAWMVIAISFEWYILNFASYRSYYAGLASVIAALYFSYLAALALIFGGEVNRAIRIRRLARMHHSI